MIQKQISYTISELFINRVRKTPDDVFAIFDGRKVTYRQLEERVRNVASVLIYTGVREGNLVALMMENHLDHLSVFYALNFIGCVCVPINVNLLGSSLEHVISQTKPTLLIVDKEFIEKTKEINLNKNLKIILSDSLIYKKGKVPIFDLKDLIKSTSNYPETGTGLDEDRVICFTSGTTGHPKGVIMTERMLLTCAIGAGIASEVKSRDVFMLWEPIYHSAGMQMCLLALMHSITLVVTKFSASTFWQTVDTYKVSKIHYLGGVIDILLKQEKSPLDSSNSASIAFGAGCKKENWKAFEDRFRIKINEVYGLTEASGFTTINDNGKIGSIGKPLSYFQVKVVCEDGECLSENKIGEILIRENIPGLITNGYYKNIVETGESLRDGWFCTGDLGYFDQDGDFYFVGRKKDSIRRRGENISCQEVESVLNTHPIIEESAIIGVEAEIGEQDIKAFIKTKNDLVLDPLDLIYWCEKKLPYFQIPRYIKFVKQFPKTPTQRIRKKDLHQDIEGFFDFLNSNVRKA